jgi:hypothetical protein
MRRGLVRSASGTRLGAAASRGRSTRSGAITSPLFEVALVLVRFDHVARIIVNANDSVCERLRNSAWLIRVDSSVYLGALYSTRKCGGCLKFAPIFRA